VELGSQAKLRKLCSSDPSAAMTKFCDRPHFNPSPSFGIVCVVIFSDGCLTISATGQTLAISISPFHSTLIKAMD